MAAWQSTQVTSGGSQVLPPPSLVEVALPRTRLRNCRFALVLLPLHIIENTVP